MLFRYLHFPDPDGEVHMARDVRIEPQPQKLDGGTAPLRTQILDTPCPVGGGHGIDHTDAVLAVVIIYPAEPDLCCPGALTAPHVSLQSLS